MNISYGYTNSGLEAACNWLRQQRQSRKFSVIDVGGYARGKSAEVSDVMVDIMSTRPNDFKFNLSNASEWAELLSYVDLHGKFDFAICTHTIEDISNPALLLEMLPRIALQGIITCPSPAAELGRHESPQYLGNIHHRHIIGWQNNSILIIPKLSVLEPLLLGEGLKCEPYRSEIRFDWKDTIPYSFFMNDFLGPDVESVLHAYQALLDEIMSGRM